MAQPTKPSSSVLNTLKERAHDPGAIAREHVPLEIQRSWGRCADNGLSLVDARRPERLTAPELRERAERFERLVGGAAPIMDNLCRQIANTHSMVILSDPAGLILHSVGDADFMNRAERVALQPGVRWDEESRGTNAIGTAAVEKTAVLVHAAQHYVERNQFLTCSASPIFDAFGELAGILDISGDYRSYQDHTLALVRLGAQMIEERLFEQSARGYHIVRFHPQRHYLYSPADARAAFSNEGRLMTLNAVGRELLGDTRENDQFETLFSFPFEQALKRMSGDALSVLACALPRGQAVAVSIQLASPQKMRSPVFPARRPASPGFNAHPAPNELGQHDARVGQAIERARRVMGSDIPLLIEGESGTGKEWLARSLHEHGPRGAQAFVAVNCAAIPETLIESELFGYEEGAFTGARKRGSIGRIREADQGTLFLDEIGDMPLALQARLLRVLQDRTVTPLGSGQTHRVDINVVCATHRNLRELIKEGRFREDLYYRLNGFTVQLPALRDRKDLKELVMSIIDEERSKDSVRLCPSVMQLFMNHPWPGNIRQLRNVLRTALVLAGDELLDEHCLAEDFVAEARHARPTDPREAANSMDAAQRSAIDEALKKHGGNVSAAARALGISRNRLYRKLRQGDSL